MKTLTAKLLIPDNLARALAKAGKASTAKPKTKKRRKTPAKKKSRGNPSWGALNRNKDGTFATASKPSPGRRYRGKAGRNKDGTFRKGRRTR